MAWLRRSLKRETMVGLYAPELPDISSDKWINSKPLKLKANRDKLAMIDFWTYSCVNCLRTLPYIKKWHERYKKDGLLVIGVHSPEFDFEKIRENVEKFVVDNEIEYPVVMDNDHEIWSLFANNYWPRKLLIDSEGRIVFDHIGEGDYIETEQAIQHQLERLHPEMSYIGSGKKEREVKSGAVCYPMTPETYCGYERGLSGNEGGFIMNRVAIYKDEALRKKDGVVFLDGVWESSSEYLRYAEDKPGGYLEILFRGVEVNAVMGSTDGKEVEIAVESRGKPIEKGIAGRDVYWDLKGNSRIKVKEEKMYSIISADLYLEQPLRLYPQSNNLRVYAFTFGNCIGV